MRVQLGTGNTAIANVTGIFEYNDSSLYTAGDFVIYLGSQSGPNDPTQYGIYFCIKDVPSAPAKQYLTNEEYFRPYWYYNTITNLGEYISALNTSNTNKVVLQKVAASVLQRKFGTGILVAAANKNDGVLDLNFINRTGRYLLLIEDYNSVSNFPPFLLSSIQNSDNSYSVIKLYGLDVFSYGMPNGPKNILQVLYSTMNNKIALAVRKYHISTWTDWHFVRCTPDTNLIGTYLQSHANIFNELFNGTRKQSFGFRLPFVKMNSGDPTKQIFRINMHAIRSSILREMHSFLVVYKIIENQNNNNTIETYYNAMFPLPNGVSTNFNVSINGQIVSCSMGIDQQTQAEYIDIEVPQKYEFIEILALS